MRVAVIGLGVIGKVHVKAIGETDASLVAVCDVVEEKLTEYPEVKGYTDYIAMLDEVKPDVVHICTPHFLHVEMILAALKRDINTICEKPMCIKEADIPLILEAERSSAASLGICFQTRYNASTQFVKEFIKNKELISAHGVVNWHRDAAYYAQGAWRGKWDTEGGGVLINQAIHTLDHMQCFCGMPDAITAVCENRSLKGIIEVEDTATLTMHGKITSTFFATNAAETDSPVQITLKAAEDEIRMQPERVWINGTEHDFTDKGVLHGKKVYGTGHALLFKDFYDCVRTGRKFEIDGAEGAKSVRIILAAYKSLGKKINL